MSRAALSFYALVRSLARSSHGSTARPSSTLPPPAFNIYITNYKPAKDSQRGQKPPGLSTKEEGEAGWKSEQKSLTYSPNLQILEIFFPKRLKKMFFDLFQLESTSLTPYTALQRFTQTSEALTLLFN